MMRSSVLGRSSAFVLAGALAVVPRAAAAQEKPEEEGAAAAANRGLRIGVGPVLLLPTDGGPLGGGLDLSARYGFRAGPTILAPGGRVAGYLFSQRFAALGMPTFRVTVPAGPLAPFVMGGVGPGWISSPSEAGVALLGGGGLMVHFGRALALGAEVSYQTITGTELQSIAIGPSILIGG